MIYLLTILFAPLALLLQRRSLQALFNAGLYVWAGVMFAVLPINPEGGVMIWLVAVIHGLFAVRMARYQDNIEVLRKVLANAKPTD